MTRFGDHRLIVFDKRSSKAGYRRAELLILCLQKMIPFQDEDQQQPRDLRLAILERLSCLPEGHHMEYLRIDFARFDFHQSVTESIHRQRLVVARVF